MQDKIKFIREKCIEANPEIVEPKFGCEILLENNQKRTITEESSVGYFETVEGCNLRVVKDAIEEIIGRPIRLADVLLAIQKITDSDFTDLVVNRWGEFLIDEPITGEESKGGFYTRVCCTWKLKDDNLNNQSPECIDFIYKLLK